MNTYELKDEIDAINQDHTLEMIFNQIFYQHLVSLDRKDTIKSLRFDPSHFSIFQRKLVSIVYGYHDYANKKGYNLGKIAVDKKFLVNPETGKWYFADVLLEYNNKVADLEADGSHENRKEDDEKRDINALLKNIVVGRFRTKNNKKLSTSKCYMVSKCFNDSDKKSVISFLNEFYVLPFNEDSVLNYINSNIYYNADYFLINEEIEAIYNRKITELEDLLCCLKESLKRKKWCES